MGGGGIEMGYAEQVPSVPTGSYPVPFVEQDGSEREMKRKKFCRSFVLMGLRQG